ncbi:hypothetical protein D0Q53_20360 [Salmonella enterica]|nr:hypothetical protein [Salmonella enterica]EFF4796197.1 hypothetical protein [Escherichia coli]EBJ6658271.1 hypothetical protein [Salmonella enterica]EBL0923883.1 hypothetical protein [Salmonella enterica]ECO7324788.1 hypothetical protein [Salmonella enterica]
MKEWVKLFKSGDFLVCVEVGREGAMPALVFRMHKDGGILRSKMAIPVESKEECAAAYAYCERLLADMDQELVDAAVASMLEMEPETLDGNRHAVMVDLNDGE